MLKYWALKALTNDDEEFSGSSRSRQGLSQGLDPSATGVGAFLRPSEGEKLPWGDAQVRLLHTVVDDVVAAALRFELPNETN